MNLLLPYSYFLKTFASSDEFHVIRPVNEAVDEVRLSERKACVELKNKHKIPVVEK